MKFKFTKVQNNHNQLRDDVILCDTCTEIVTGKTVVLTGPGRDFVGHIRVIETSVVTSFDKLNENLVRITTKSGSVYDIETL